MTHGLLPGGRFLSVAFALSLLCTAAISAAQPAAPPAPPPGEAALPAAPPAPTRKDALAEALAPQAGGTTPDSVADAAVRTSYSLRGKQEDLRAAQAKVDQAFTNYYPRLTLTATYTRLSEVDSSLGGSGGNIVGAANPGLITVGPCAPGSPAQCLFDSGGEFVGAVPFGITIPSQQNSYSLVASLVVPVSDYVLRISQGVAAASGAARAKEIEVRAQELQIAADAKVAYYNWVRAKGQVVVAEDAVAQTKAHLVDAKQAFEVGLLSKADVLRLDAQVAAAEQTVVDAKAFEGIAGEQVRTVMHLPAGTPLTVGIDVLGASGGPPAEALDTLTQEAYRNRLEMQVLDENLASLREAESLTRAGYYPRLDAFANGTYANPNQRYFGSTDEFNFSWEAGLRLSWTVNDTLATGGAAAEAEARTASVAQQRQSLLDGLRLEVAAAHAESVRAVASIEASERGLVAVEESMRVRRELFKAGKATSVDIVDAEAELTRAHLRRLDAHVGLLAAKAKLEHVTGRDVRAARR